MKPLASKRRTRALSTALLLIGLAILLFTGAWWPGIMLVIGIPLALRQFLLGRNHDMILSLFIFVGFFVIAQFDISWQILAPILFIMGAIYVLCREWVESVTPTEEDEEEDLNKQIEEDTPKD